MQKKIAIFMAKDDGEFDRYRAGGVHGDQSIWAHPYVNVLPSKGLYSEDEDWEAGTLKIVIGSLAKGAMNLTPDDGEPKVDEEVMRKLVGKMRCKIGEKIDLASEDQVYFLRHWGSGGSWRAVLKGEAYLQDWIRKHELAPENWHFFSLSSVRPELLDLNLEKIVIPSGRSLVDWLDKLQKGYFSLQHSLEREYCQIIDWLKGNLDSVQGEVALVIFGAEDEVLRKKIDKLICENAILQEYGRRGKHVLLVTQNGVQYSNWAGWHFGEFLTAEVFRKFGRIFGAEGRVRVYCQHDAGESMRKRSSILWSYIPKDQIEMLNGNNNKISVEEIWEFFKTGRIPDSNLETQYNPSQDLREQYSSIVKQLKHK